MSRETSNELNDFLSVYPPEVIGLYLATRDTVLGIAPDANELIYDAYNALSVVYSFTENLKQGFIHIAAYPKHVNLGFNQGAALPDPESRLQGTGTRIRHIKIKERKTLANKEVLDLTRSAMRHGEKAASLIQGSAKSKCISLVKSVSSNKRRPL